MHRKTRSIPSRVIPPLTATKLGNPPSPKNKAPPIYSPTLHVTLLLPPSIKQAHQHPSPRERAFLTLPLYGPRHFSRCSCYYLYLRLVGVHGPSITLPAQIISSSSASQCSCYW